MLFYTFCCLACTTVNDLLFKFFARKERSRGMFVSAVGVTGTLLMMFLPDKIGDNWKMTLLWGVICGIMSAVGNILLIESMTTLSAGVCSTIYRLNLALVVPCSVFFLHEKLNPWQYLGVALAIAAVIFFLPFEKGEKKDRKKLFSMYTGNRSNPVNSRVTTRSSCVRCNKIKPFIVWASVLNSPR